MLVWASYTFVALIDSLCFWDHDSISDEKYITMKAIRAFGIGALPVGYRGFSDHFHLVLFLYRLDSTSSKIGVLALLGHFGLILLINTSSSTYALFVHLGK